MMTTKVVQGLRCGSVKKISVKVHCHSSGWMAYYLSAMLAREFCSLTAAEQQRWLH
jgi:hypothetical protein